MEDNIPNIHLVSFADGVFKNRAKGFINEAEKMDVFNSINVFTFDDLDVNYKNNHREFIYSNPRGFGYWIWKPQIVLQQLELIQENDILVYMDVGFELNHTGRYRFLEYVQLTLAHKYKMLSFSNTHTEYRWNKMDLALRLEIQANSSLLFTSQLAAGFFMFQKNLQNIDLLSQWAGLAVADNYHYSDDSASLVANHPMFIEHRHDASIFSLLRKLRGTEVTHYEVQKYTHFDNVKTLLPAWALRKGRNSKLDY
jgi:hypothetical protein